VDGEGHRGCNPIGCIRRAIRSLHDQPAWFMLLEKFQGIDTTRCAAPLPAFRAEWQAVVRIRRDIRYRASHYRRYDGKLAHLKPALGNATVKARKSGIAYEGTFPFRGVHSVKKTHPQASPRS